MTNLATMFPQVDVNQLGPVAGMMLGDMFNIAKQNNTINQQGALGTESRAQEMHPLEMGFKQAQTGYQNALSKQAGAQAEKSIWDLEQDKRLAEPKYQSELAKLRASASESEVKQAHAQLEQQLMSPDPNVRKQAETMYKATGDMLKMYEQENEKRKTSVQVAGINAASAEKRANARGGGARIPRTNQEALQYWLMKAQDPEADEADRTDALAMAEQIRTTMMELAASRGQPFTIGPDGRIAPNPNAPGKSTPLAVPGVNIPPSSATTNRPTRQAEAARPKAKEGYIVVYKDGKPVGQVPQGQAELAKKQGYTLE